MIGDSVLSSRNYSKDKTSSRLESSVSGNYSGDKMNSRVEN